MFKRRKPNGTPATDPTDPASADAATKAPPATSGAPVFQHHVMGPRVTENHPGDAGLDLPPFRPAPAKGPNDKTGRPLFPSPAGQSQLLRSAGSGRSHPRDPSGRRTLVVGRGISLQGNVADAERLVVEGVIAAGMIHATELSIAPGGVFRGKAEMEEVEIAGTFDGTLTVRGSLCIRSTGRLLGTACCHRLQVEEGGQISGCMEMLTEASRSEVAQANFESAA